MIMELLFIGDFTMFIIYFCVIFIYQVIKFGRFITDEMQYYGQVKGLLDTNRLFSNDFYIYNRALV